VYNVILFFLIYMVIFIICFLCILLIKWSLFASVKSVSFYHLPHHYSGWGR